MLELSQECLHTSLARIYYVPKPSKSHTCSEIQLSICLHSCLLEAAATLPAPLLLETTLCERHMTNCTSLYAVFLQEPHKCCVRHGFRWHGFRWRGFRRRGSWRGRFWRHCCCCLANTVACHPRPLHKRTPKGRLKNVEKFCSLTNVCG